MSGSKGESIREGSGLSRDGYALDRVRREELREPEAREAQCSEAGDAREVRSEQRLDREHREALRALLLAPLLR